MTKEVADVTQNLPIRWENTDNDMPQMIYFTSEHDREIRKQCLLETIWPISIKTGATRSLYVGVIQWHVTLSHAYLWRSLTVICYTQLTYHVAFHTFSWRPSIIYTFFRSLTHRADANVRKSGHNYLVRSTLHPRVPAYMFRQPMFRFNVPPWNQSVTFFTCMGGTWGWHLKATRENKPARKKGAVWDGSVFANGVGWLIKTTRQEPE